MNKKDFVAGVSLCDCGSPASKWLSDGPCCDRCQRRDAVPRAETTGHGVTRHDVPLSADAHDGALTMRDLTMIESMIR